MKKNIPPGEIVIHEIFPRLPPASVIRLSSACKSWRSSTVRDLPFLTAHRARWCSQSRPSCLILKSFRSAQMARMDVGGGQDIISIQDDDMVNLCNNNNNQNQEEDIMLHNNNNNNKAVAIRKEPTDPNSLCLVGSCDSLLCFAIRGMKYYHVHNLSTKDWITVPTVVVYRRRYNLVAFLRAFYYHPSTAEYRLLAWFKILLPSTIAANPHQQQRSPPPSFGVFSLKLGAKWRLIDGQPPHCPIDVSRLTQQGYGMFQPRATAHRYVHWAPMSNYPWILAFNVETENFTQFHIPRPLRQRQHSGCTSAFYREDYQVITLGQQLVLSYTTLPCEIQLWLLKDYKHHEEEECWVKLHTISVPTIINAMSSANHDERDYNPTLFQPVGLCSAATDGEDLLLLRYSEQVFILYNLISKRIRWVTAHQSCGIFAALLTGTLSCLMYSFN